MGGDTPWGPVAVAGAGLQDTGRSCGHGMWLLSGACVESRLAGSRKEAFTLSPDGP